jgi:hypothetical protein
MSKIFGLESLKGRDNFEDQGIDGRIIFNKSSGKSGRV